MSCPQQHYCSCEGNASTWQQVARRGLVHPTISATTAAAEGREGSKRYISSAGAFYVSGNNYHGERRKLLTLAGSYS